MVVVVKTKFISRLVGGKSLESQHNKSNTPTSKADFNVIFALPFSKIFLSFS